MPHPTVEGLNLQLGGTGPRCVLVTIMKNEAPYIVEWACYHYALGFREILVFSNFSDDYTDQILDRLDDLGIVRHRPHPINAFSSVGQVQISALRFAQVFPQFKASEYMMMIDADEFLEVQIGSQDLAALFDHFGEFEVASFRMRGRRFPDDTLIGDGQMLSRFSTATYSNPADLSKHPTGANSVKSLAKSKLKKGFHRNHRPMVRGFSSLGLRWLDGSGQNLPPDFTDRRVSSVHLDDREQVAIVNHYAVRSAEGFLAKMLRGDAAVSVRNNLDEAAVRSWIEYWTARKRGGERVEVPAKLPPGFTQLFGTIMSDQVIRKLQDAAIEVHRSKAKLVLESPFGRRIATAFGLD